MALKATQDLFAVLSGQLDTDEPEIDVLDEYLKTAVKKSVTDPLAYWNALLTSERDRPLAQMALDFLSFPGM